MGVFLRSVGISTDEAVGSSLEHAAVAGRRCLEAAGVGPGEIGGLIHAGVYRDDNLVEPSIACLVQKRLRVSLDFVRDAGVRPAFSFDVTNGACGALQAIQVARSIQRTGGPRHVLVVASNAHPSADPAVAWPFATAGAAVLLERDDGRDGGFVGDFATRLGSVPAGLRGYFDFGRPTRRDIVIEQEPGAGFERRCLDLLGEAIRDLGGPLDRALLLPGQMSPGFALRLAASLGLGPDAVVTVEGVARDPHVSAVLLAYHEALVGGRLEGFERLVFAAVGSGPSAIAADYRP